MTDLKNDLGNSLWISQFVQNLEHCYDPSANLRRREGEVSKHRMATDNIARVLMENDDTIIKQMQFSWRCNLHMTH